MAKAARLLDNLAVVRKSAGTFVGKSWDLGWGEFTVARSWLKLSRQLKQRCLPLRMLLQPLDARIRCIPYFVRAGSIEDVEYRVETIRDGRSFSLRAVNAYQNEGIIFTMQASFQDDECGLEHQHAEKIDWSTTPPASKCRSREDYTKEVEHLLPEQVRESFTTPGPILLRPTRPFRPLTRLSRPRPRACG